jgi:hypothetical protein
MPGELSSLGRVDACHAELRAGPALRAGMIVGLRPDPATADVSVERPVAATYVSTTVGKPGVLRVAGNLGLLTTVYEGRPDRLACVLSQTTHVGTGLQLRSATEVDLPTEARATRVSGVQLTGIRVEARTPLTSFLCLRAGLDHHKHPDTREHRAAAGPGDDALFREGSWRRWVGCSHDLPGRLRLDEELSLDTRPSGGEMERRWAISLTRTGLPCLPTARIQASFRSVDGLSPGRMEGRIGGELTFFRDRLMFQPSVGLARSSTEAGPGRVEVTSVALRASWRPDTSCSVEASGGWVLGGRTDVPVFQIGLRCTF